MPTEPELAAALGVSRATVRDAVKVLSGKGLVRTARRYGTRVTPVEAWNLLDGDVIAWHEMTIRACAAYSPRRPSFARSWSPRPPRLPRGGRPPGNGR